MTCGEAREYLFAFLDSELDAPLSIELQRHLDGCPSCAPEAEIERMIRKRLAQRFADTGSAVPELAAAWVSALASPNAVAATQGPRAPATRSGWLRHLATAAAILLMVGVGVWLALDRGGDGRDTPRFTRLLVNDFEHFLEEGSRVQYGSAQSQKVADWLCEQTALAVVLPTPSDARYELIGGRKCKIDERPAAFAIYDMIGSPVSLVAVSSQPGLLNGMREVRHGDATHWMDQWKGHTVVACQRDGLVYAAVSELPEEELLCLMWGALDESD